MVACTEQQVLPSQPGTLQSRCASATTRECDVTELASLQLEKSATDWSMSNYHKKVYMEHTFLALLCLKCHAAAHRTGDSSPIHRTMTEWISPHPHVAQNAPLVEHPSTSSPQRGTSAWPFPHCSPLDDTNSVIHSMHNTPV